MPNRCPPKRPDVPPHRRRWLGSVLLCAALLSGCAGLERRPPLTIDDVVQRSRAGTPPAELIRELDQTRTVLAITGSRYARLKAEGVSDEVLDYLQKSFIAALEFEARMHYQTFYWGWGFPYPPSMRPFPPYMHR